MIPVALTIAGSDSSGGAGIQADLKTFSAFGVYGAAAITALTAQNSNGVSGVTPVSPTFIEAQIAAVAGDLDVKAAKTGMLATRAAVLAVCHQAETYELAPLVVDPVMVATSGDSLLDADAIGAIRHHLIPRARLITPNLPEAARLLDLPQAGTLEEVRRQGEWLISRFGAAAVLIKGGHGTGDQSVDVLLTSDAVFEFALPRLDVESPHGTGCTLSAAITALLALGTPLPEAAERAKKYVWNAMAAGRRLKIGHGPAGALDHHYAQRIHGLPE